MTIQSAINAADWESFLTSQRFSPFLQSWTMGEVYREIGQEPIRLEAREDGKITGICQAIVVPARRGKHLMVQYGPIVHAGCDECTADELLHALKNVARDHHCSFIRVSPFLPEDTAEDMGWPPAQSLPSPLHLLSEYTWYISLRSIDRWRDDAFDAQSEPRTEESIKAEMRKTTRNLIGRAEREGVSVEASKNPEQDLDIYFKLQEETYKRHHFVPYRESYIRAQVKHFAPLNQAIVYIARYQGEPVAASVHMTYGGVTSYHHGASTHKYAKIPASYLLQWTAISDALKRGDSIYNFWGIAPPIRRDPQTSPTPDPSPEGGGGAVNKRHPFAGVTTFKTGFGGKPLPLVHCTDLPLTSGYKLTRAFEFMRKWKRGF